MFFDEITPSIVHESTSRPDSGESPTSEHNDLDLDAAAGLYCAVEEVFFFFTLCPTNERAFLANHHWQPAGQR